MLSNASCTTRKTAPISRLSSKFVLTFNKTGQLHSRAVSGSKPKLLVTQQPALDYFPGDPSDQEILEELAKSVKYTDVCVGRRQCGSFTGFCMDTTQACLIVNTSGYGRPPVSTFHGCEQMPL
jgi:hypothetical protein